MSGLIGKTVWLRDCDSVPIESERYSKELVARARQAQIAKGLRVDNRTGMVYARGGWVSRYVTPSDHEPATDLETLVFNAFRGFVLNSASRLSRGFEA